MITEYSFTKYIPVVIVMSVSHINRYVMSRKTKATKSRTIRTIDKSRLDERVGHLNRFQMRKVDEALRISMGVKKMDKPALMTLCPICAKPFYESEEHYIKRADLHQKIKTECMFCNVRTGYDYLIRKKY